MPSYSWTIIRPAAAPATERAPFVFADEAGLLNPDFGYDIMVFPQLDMTWTPRNDALSLADSFARRLLTPRGKLWAHPNYGFDLLDYLNSIITKTDLHAIQSGIEAQGEQDERIFSVAAKVTYYLATQLLKVAASVTSEVGPFSMVLQVTSLTTDIIVEA